MRFSLLLIVLLGSASLIAQTSYQGQRERPVTASAKVSMSDFAISEGTLEYVEYPKPGGQYYHAFLQKQKERSAALFPERTASSVRTRSSLDPPVLLSNFPGNPFTGGIPLDNHIAVSNDGIVVTVVNVNMAVLNTDGVSQGLFNLDDFWAALGENDRYFDPRIIYDPAEDRFIIAMMQDFDCSGSNIVFAFSETNDPAGNWYLYQFEGCPRMDATFADFPMISITDRELFFTYNAVFQDSTWQTGFNETFIYQIDKMDGYAGEELDWMSWSDIRDNGRLMRYICPVKYATPEMESEAWFVSNRSFDIENDTIWLINISGSLEEGEPVLNVEHLLSDMPYGVPPNARQPMDRLQTNDARILDGFFIDDHIQFVSSTVDQQTGLSAVFHGIIEDVSFDPKITTTILGDSELHRAYPGIVYTGVNQGDRDAIILALHSSTETFPGFSALYANFDYSDWVMVKEGFRNIDMIRPGNPFDLDPTLERWGDYVGIQPKYNEQGIVWTAACYGKPGSVNDTWVGQLRSPAVETSTVNAEQLGANMKVYPNPFADIVTVEGHAEADGADLEIQLFDASGKLVDVVLDERVSSHAPFRFTYAPKNLANGIYILRASLDGKQFATERVVVK